MRLGRDGIAGLIGLAVSLILLPHAFGLPRLPIVPIGPGFYPTLVLVFMAGTCALLVVQDVLARRRQQAGQSAAAVEATPGAYGIVASAFMVVAAYIALLPMLGFRISTVAFVAAFQLLLERPTTLRQWLMVGALAVGTAAITYLAFERYLSVLLPRGAWTGW